MSFSSRFVRTHLLVLLVVTLVTSWFSYAFFHIDEYFQVLELTRAKLAPDEVASFAWEHAARLRPWLQPFLYWLLARVLHVREIFALGLLFRIVTGLANVVAVAFFLRTTLPLQRTEAEARLHVRAVTLAGFLPYLFVRTSSESASMAAMVLGWSLLFAAPVPDGREPRLRTALAAGFLFGLAFEFRFQTAFFVVGILAWLVVHGVRRALVPITLAGLAAVALGALIDHWGYGEWTFPAWNYLRANVLEGAAGMFGKEPPFAYFWLDASNVFGPIALALFVVMIVAWIRAPRHPLTWTTLPFFVAHGLISHKEERFVFPMAIFVLGMVTLAAGDSPPRLARVGAWLHARRKNPVLLFANFAPMVLLALYPLGWNHHVRFERAMHARFGDALHAAVLPEIELNPPPFHMKDRVLEKMDVETLAHRIDDGAAPEWLIADRPVLATGFPAVDDHYRVEYSELPGDDALRRRLAGWVDAYNADAKPPLRRLRYRTLYRFYR